MPYAIRSWVLAAALGSTLALAACDGGNVRTGGHCLTVDDICWEVANPPGYDMGWMCNHNGPWYPGTCDPAGYESRCTEDREVLINNGPPMTVRFVSYLPARSTYVCMGVEEDLP